MTTRCETDILVVDDNEVNVQLAVHFVKKLGYRAATAGSGRAAVERTAVERFRLILMDLQMPDIDGVEATLRIRARDGARVPRVVIIGLSAETSSSVRRACLVAGMDDYLEKPIDTSALKSCLAKWLATPTTTSTNAGE